MGGALRTPPNRGDVVLVRLDPARGGEIRKTRPCVVVSPDELNHNLPTFIVAPITTGAHAYPFRVPCRFKRRTGHVVLDQIRTVDSERLVRRLGVLSSETVDATLGTLRQMFAR